MTCNGSVSKTTSLQFTPKKRLVPPGDPFFEEGDLRCSLLVKQLPVIDDLEELFTSKRTEFQCDVAGCSLAFSSLSSYESHYNSCHRHCCQTCKRSLPSAYLLELHVTENHDNFFQAMASKTNMYCCLVESCKESFPNQDSRKDHLVVVHNYPSDFRFNRPTRARRKQIKREKADAAMDTQDAKENEAPAEKTDKGVEDMSSVLDAMEITPGTRERCQARLPKNFCFGRGSQRAFHRGNSAGTKQKQKKQATKKNAGSKNTTQENTNEVEMMADS